ncbi:peptide-N4-(N-acetyl-beta-glucosaminyl)asparagine amidase A-like [Nicotiana sylvestris]|uniref:Peptide-N4-(N-acetyl-beta- glucosaminyl)asparagine amidase A-like n=2 Tax=Nicotiana TaxID=4085 RepID=A0A1S3YCH0_TOBAC|nr:PREDICTED: peptide-N4-(N-acetyl-beta-glucosaminyl)asparagine amidase A-like [Nicotiana sylvestris]XP_016449905.1 PREDICTED: peptide-N4-(N-acetyl-beta-glucosaminyl)asparagine amidase A-like [Nicotiana tabacum]
MAFSFLLLAFFSLLQQPLFSTATLHSSTSLFRSQLISQLHSSSSKNATPTTYFEVTKPINLPKTKPCSYLVLQHDFGYTYGKPPVLANYTPPSNCPSQKFSKIVLEWKATCKGRQFDRIFGVWLSGVEIFRSCTAEPRANGIIWTVKKDITRYYSLLMTNQTLAVYIGNLVDSTYTGVYNVKLFIHFYPAEEKHSDNGLNLEYSYRPFDSGADLILPISRNLPLNDGSWFEVENSTDVLSKELKIPQNAYRAVLEVYVSFHENDEFWYSNPPNDYIRANNLSDTPGNGAFREVVVSMDDMIVGAVWPFTVIYTGGVNPLLWRPISGIGSFDLPSYDIEITPLLGKILDGHTHKISFSVTNALNVWYIDANLHLWLDEKSIKTEAKLFQYSSLPLSFSLVTNFTGIDGSFLTNASRSITLTGWVKSSYGNITTKSAQSLSYSNYMVMGNEGNLQIVDQIIYFNDTVDVMMPSSSVQSLESFKKFLLLLDTDNVDKGDRSYASISNITLGFDDKRVKSSEFGSSASLTENMQKAQGYILVKGRLVVSGLGSTQQVYKYKDDSCCYSRNISSSNYTIHYDKVSDNCPRNTSSRWPFSFGKFWSVPARRVFLASHFGDVKDGV